MSSFKIYDIWAQADIHTHNFRKCSHASAGLTWAHPNYIFMTCTCMWPVHAPSEPPTVSGLASPQHASPQALQTGSPQTKHATAHSTHTQYHMH